MIEIEGNCFRRGVEGFCCGAYSLTLSGIWVSLSNPPIPVVVERWVVKDYVVSIVSILRYDMNSSDDIGELFYVYISKIRHVSQVIDSPRFRMPILIITVLFIRAVGIDSQSTPDEQRYNVQHPLSQSQSEFLETASHASAWKDRGQTAESVVRCIGERETVSPSEYSDKDQHQSPNIARG